MLVKGGAIFQLMSSMLITSRHRLMKSPFKFARVSGGIVTDGVLVKWGVI